MLEAIKPLIDSGLVNEETKAQIQEAWDAKIVEAKNDAKAELREEFAARYAHDKSVMVEALEKMVNSSLKEELEEFVGDKKKLAEERVAFKKFVLSTGKNFQGFLTNRLAEEIKELRTDRKSQAAIIGKLEKFVIESLAEELNDFSKDKKDLAETKVKLMRAAKTKLESVQKQFITRGAKVVKEAITKNLKAELSQFKNDVKLARENMFGRKIYEAFAGEFAVTHLNENTEIQKLRTQLAQKDKVIKESKVELTNKQRLVEGAMRGRVLSELSNTLTGDKKTLMLELLENVQTPKLKSAFDKYLPAVLNNQRPVASVKKTLTEGHREVTGNKTARKAPRVDNEGKNNILEFQRLAGLK